MSGQFKKRPKNDVPKTFIHDEKRTTLGRRILGLSGRFSLNVLSVSDIDGETTSEKLRPANFHLGSI